MSTLEAHTKEPNGYSIIKYLTFMTNGDLSIATDLGYLNESREVTPKGYLELTDVARVKGYPVAPKLSALDKLFM